MAKMTYDEDGIPIRPAPEFKGILTFRVDEQIKIALNKLLESLKGRGVRSPSAAEVIRFGIIKGVQAAAAEDEAQQAHGEEPAPQTAAEESPSKPSRRKGGKT